MAWGTGIRCPPSWVVAVISSSLLAGALFVLQSAPRRATGTSPLLTPAWHDFGLVDGLTRPFEQAVLPVALLHLNSLHVNETFAPIWISSAFLDTRPLVVGAEPEIAILGVGPSALALEVFWNETPLLCNIVFRPAGGWSEVKHLTVAAAVNAMPDGHVESKPWGGIIVTCPLLDADGKGVDWEGADILVTISAAGYPPPPDVFKRVAILPMFDPVHHRLGAGTGAVCLQPLVGNTYAPSMRDFIAYYKALGFSDFYAYLLDPAAETLALMKELEADPGFHPIRWALPLEWSNSWKDYRVRPQQWGLKALPTLSTQDEEKYSYSGSNPPKLDVRVWAFAQNVAHHDCSYRAKIAGNRWTAMVDWDEYLLLRPPSGIWPPPNRGLEGSLIGDWAATLDDAAKDVLPSAFLFQSAFLCILCEPTNPPVTATGLPLPPTLGTDGLHPTSVIPSIFVSPVRHEEWFYVGFRAKALIDCWAWFDGTIHQPVVSFGQYAFTRCQVWAVNMTQEQCWRSYANIVRPEISLVHPPPVTNVTRFVTETKHGLGAMYHLRASSNVAAAVAEWSDVADKEGLDLFTSEKGRAMFSKTRSGEDLWSTVKPSESWPGNIVEDWTLATTMSGALEAILAERRARPLRRWTGQRWVGGASGLTRRWIILGLAVCLLALLGRRAKAHRSRTVSALDVRDGP